MGSSGLFRFDDAPDQNGLEQSAKMMRRLGSVVGFGKTAQGALK
jgi:hypothetical protein